MAELNLDHKSRLIANSPFASIISGITSKSEAAQCTFIHRLLQAVNGEVLQTAHKYAKEEIKKRVTPKPTLR